MVRQAMAAAAASWWRHGGSGGGGMAHHEKENRQALRALPAHPMIKSVGMVSAAWRRQHRRRGSNSQL